ncbi:MAG: ABC transporter substrate-binding protein [Syntrophobacteraceae bacterium]|jgi:phospholipid transport system substrate-binding protein|nr:ABC transporter substrate-binding protein [Syntrophobacteraceae bacterium]
MKAVFSRSLTVLGVLFMLNLLVWSAPASTSASATPLAVVQSGTDRALEVLKNRRAVESTSLRDRRDEVFGIVDAYFNFGEMARRALGRPWRDQPPEKQREFVDLFKELLFNTYVDRVDSYKGSNSERVEYDGETIEGRYALVKTRLVGYRQSDIVVEYRLLLEGGEWKVYDVVVEGISFINNYRQQFNSILASESFDSLLSRLREKVAMQGR